MPAEPQQVRGALQAPNLPLALRAELLPARILQGAAQAAQACFLAQQTGEKALKALLAAEDRAASLCVV